MSRRSAFSCGMAAVLPSHAFDDTAALPGESAVPSYLSWERDALSGVPVTRITGNPGSPIAGGLGTWGAMARHHYSKDAAWNCDQSLVLLAKHSVEPRLVFLDGTSFVPQFTHTRFEWTDIRWHAKQPMLMYFVRGNELGLWDVAAGACTVIARFDDYSDLGIGPWEGNFSDDGSMVVLSGMRAGRRSAFAFDLDKRFRHRDIELDGLDVDFITVSASGRLIILNGVLTGERGDQSRVLDLDGNQVAPDWNEYGRPSHWDLAIDSDGADIAVGVSKSGADEGRVIKRRLKDGKVTVLTSAGYATHTSTRNVRRPGWAYVTYQHRNVRWPPYWDELIAVPLDGSMSVQRIARLRSPFGSYDMEAQAVPSGDGRFVLWSANWGSTAGPVIGTLVARLEHGRACSVNRLEPESR